LIAVYDKRFSHMLTTLIDSIDQETVQDAQKIDDIQDDMSQMMSTLKSIKLEDLVTYDSSSSIEKPLFNTNTNELGSDAHIDLEFHHVEPFEDEKFALEMKVSNEQQEFCKEEFESAESCCLMERVSEQRSESPSIVEQIDYVKVDQIKLKSARITQLPNANGHLEAELRSQIDFLKAENENLNRIKNELSIEYEKLKDALGIQTEKQTQESNELTEKLKKAKKLCQQYKQENAKLANEIEMLKQETIKLEGKSEEMTIEFSNELKEALKRNESIMNEREKLLVRIDESNSEMTRIRAQFKEKIRL